MDRTAHRRYLASAALGFALAAVTLPGYVETFPINVFHPEYAVWAGQIEFAGRPGEVEPEILVLGDSRAHAAVLPAELGAPARSLAAAGATPIEAHSLFTRYLAHHAPPRLLVVSFTPIHLEYDELFWERTARWKLIPTSDALTVFRRAEALADPILGRPDAAKLSLRWLRLRANLPVDYAAELRASKLGMRRGRNLGVLAELEQASGQRFYGGADAASEPNNEVGRIRFQPSPLLDFHLREILDVAAEHGTLAVFAAMPMNQSSLDRIDPRYAAGWDRHLARLAAGHPEVVWRSKLWSLPDDHFGDGSHVNLRGARAATRRLAADLRAAARISGKSAAASL
jgi:hypothetical protein